MKSSITKGLLAYLFLSVVLLTAAHAATVTLFTDNFNDITTGNSTNSSGSNSAWDGAGRYVITNAYKAGYAVRLGKTGAAGSLTTTNLVIQAGTLHVQFAVKGWTTDKADMVIHVAGQSASFDSDALMAGSFETNVAHFAVAAGSYAVTFLSTPEQSYLDSILITETVSDNMVTLDAPVAYVPPTTNDTGFTASWSAVGNAESYQLSVYALTVVGSVTNATPISGSPFTVATGTTTRSVTGLTQDSLYR